MMGSPRAAALLLVGAALLPIVVRGANYEVMAHGSAMASMTSPFR